MTATVYGRNAIADQRYYHFATLRTERAQPLSKVWRAIGNTIVPDRPTSWKHHGIAIEHRKVRSDLGFARGELLERLSERGNGRKPFLYDLFAARMEIGRDSYVLVGFPFVGLARAASTSSLGWGPRTTIGEFLAVDVQKLVNTMESRLTRRFEDLQSRVVGLEFAVTGDKSLTMIRLGGEQPLSAAIYREYLKPKSKAHRAHSCILGCEREWQEESGAGGVLLRSRVHLEVNGYIKAHAQRDCVNLRVVPYAIGQLASLDCLRPAEHNPFARVHESEAE
jgi:hypothetical protein